MDIFENKAIILFDGECSFCNSSVKFVFKKDKNAYFKFTSLQSDVGRLILDKFNKLNEKIDTVILYENQKLYTKSTAALRIARKLKNGWKLLYMFIIIPRFLRDVVYDFIAKHRYKIVPKKEVCEIPDKVFLDRIIESKT